MTQTRTDVDPREPRQRRTRDAQRRIAEAAIALMTTGEDFTMAAVAERADVSVTAIYRRYANKEALMVDTKDIVLTKQEADLEDAVVHASSIGDVVSNYITTLCATVGGNGLLFPSIMDMRNPDEMRQRGRLAITRTKETFVAGVERYLTAAERDLHHAEVAFLADTIVGGTLYRAITTPTDDTEPWDTYGRHLIDTVAVYLSHRLGRELLE